MQTEQEFMSEAVRAGTVSYTHLDVYKRQDPVKAVVVDMTPLGLVEITRKKIRRPLREQLNETD